MGKDILNRVANKQMLTEKCTREIRGRKNNKGGEIKAWKRADFKFSKCAREKVEHNTLAYE